MIDLDESYSKLCSLVELRASYAELERSGGEHPNTAKVWKELADLLAVSDDVAVALLERCSEDQIYYISEVFDDVSEALNDSSVFTGYIDALPGDFIR